jgi:hypothetical protein
MLRRMIFKTNPMVFVENKINTNTIFVILSLATEMCIFSLEENVNLPQCILHAKYGA